MLNFDEQAFKSFIERLPICIACFDDQRRYIALNEVCVQINGLSREQTLGYTIDEIMPGLVDALTPVFDKVYLRNETVNDKLIEGTTPASEQTRFWLANYQPLPLGNGKRGLLVTAEEITQQVFANKSAETNKRLLTDVLNSLFSFVGLLDAEGVLLDANSAPLVAAGIDLQDVQGKYFWDCFWWTYSTTAQAKIKRAVEQVQAGNAVRFDIDVRVANGFLSIDFMMEALRDESGLITHIIPSAIDISERKKTEEQLKLSQARFETVINRTIDGLVAFDEIGTIQFVNRRFEELTSSSTAIGSTSIYEYLDDEQIKVRLASLINEVNTKGIHVAIQRSNKNLSQDVCILHPNDIQVEVALSPLLDGTDVLYLATVSDVSALYSANQALEKALKEKTVLLNEIHHRVKNNLQVMSSLLNLQANAEGTELATREALFDSQRRLKSMALIHELLYERDDIIESNLQVFTHKLLQLLQDSMTDADKVAVVKRFTDEPLFLKLEQMVPFGFLITELITNAFKYAFSKEHIDSPEIAVSIYKTDGYIEVSIKDNGCGIEPTTLADKQSLGGELIGIFAKQLKAELRTTNNQGVLHRLRF